MECVGPSLGEGALPALIYFALSAEESLYQDPYNQPVVYLQNRRLRIFSLSLPAHGPGLRPQDAIGKWADEYALGKDPLSAFLDKAAVEIEALIQKGIALPGRIGLMGLSRGGLICGHLAARLPDVAAWVGFAPVTKLTKTQEFQSLKEDQRVKNLNLETIAPALSKKPARLYISNRDTRVGTRECFELVELLASQSFDQGTRSPPFELIISPPIGLMGHGTSREIFCSGAEWIANKIGAD